MSCMSNVKYRYGPALGYVKTNKHSSGCYAFVALLRGSYNDFCMYSPLYGHWNVKFYNLFRYAHPGKKGEGTPYVVEVVEAE